MSNTPHSRTYTSTDLSISSHNMVDAYNATENYEITPFPLPEQKFALDSNCTNSNNNKNNNGDSIVPNRNSLNNLNHNASNSSSNSNSNSNSNSSSMNNSYQDSDVTGSLSSKHRKKIGTFASPLSTSQPFNKFKNKNKMNNTKNKENKSNNKNKNKNKNKNRNKNKEKNGNQKVVTPKFFQRNNMSNNNNNKNDYTSPRLSHSSGSNVIPNNNHSNNDENENDNSNTNSYSHIINDENIVNGTRTRNSDTNGNSRDKKDYKSNENSINNNNNTINDINVDINESSNTDDSSDNENDYDSEQLLYIDTNNNDINNISNNNERNRNGDQSLKVVKNEKKERKAKTTQDRAKNGKIIIKNNKKFKGNESSNKENEKSRHSHDENKHTNANFIHRDTIRLVDNTGIKNNVVDNIGSNNNNNNNNKLHKPHKSNLKWKSKSKSKSKSQSKRKTNKNEHIAVVTTSDTMNTIKTMPPVPGNVKIYDSDDDIHNQDNIIQDNGSTASQTSDNNDRDNSQSSHSSDSSHSSNSGSNSDDADNNNNDNGRRSTLPRDVKIDEMKTRHTNDDDNNDDNDDNYYYYGRNNNNNNVKLEQKSSGIEYRVDIATLEATTDETESFTKRSKIHGINNRARIMSRDRISTVSSIGSSDGNHDNIDNKIICCGHNARNNKKSLLKYYIFYFWIIFNILCSIALLIPLIFIYILWNETYNDGTTTKITDDCQNLNIFYRYDYNEKKVQFDQDLISGIEPLTASIILWFLLFIDNTLIQRYYWNKYQCDKEKLKIKLTKIENENIKLREIRENERLKSNVSDTDVVTTINANKNDNNNNNDNDTTNNDTTKKKKNQIMTPMTVTSNKSRQSVRRITGYSTSELKIKQEEAPSKHERKKECKIVFTVFLLASQLFATIFVNVALVIILEYMISIEDNCYNDTDMYKMVIDDIGIWFRPLTVVFWAVNATVVLFWLIYLICC